MAGESGDFDINGREFTFEVTQLITNNGDEYDGSDMEDHLWEADQVFYKAQGPNEHGEIEEYYRWLGGPFESWDDVEGAIQDEVEVYA